MDSSKMREQVSKEFKAWFADYEKSREANGWMPLEPFVVTHMHNAFVASREAVVVELPGSHEQFKGDKHSFMFADEVRAAIEAQGLKVAP